MAAKQLTEMLKGTLDGIVLAIISLRPSYGYEIRTQLQDRGFVDIAEGTVYALLIRLERRGLVEVERIDSEKGPPRKVYSLSALGRSYLDDFWAIWRLLSDRISLIEGETEKVFTLSAPQDVTRK